MVLKILKYYMPKCSKVDTWLEALSIYSHSVIHLECIINRYHLRDEGLNKFQNSLNCLRSYTKNSLLVTLTMHKANLNSTSEAFFSILFHYLKFHKYPSSTFPS